MSIYGLQSFKYWLQQDITSFGHTKETQFYAFYFHYFVKFLGKFYYNQDKYHLAI